MSLFRELQRRNVIRVAILYLIASWLLLQITDVFSSLLPVPDWAGSLALLLLVVGLPPVMVFSWGHEFTPYDVKREKKVGREESITCETGRKLNILTSVTEDRHTARVAIVVLLLAAGALLTGCTIDKSVRVDSDAGNKSYRIIDGNLDVENGYRIRGARVIDGNVYLHGGSEVSGTIRVIDGKVRLYGNNRIGGGIHVINGDLDADSGAIIDGDVSLQHGTLDLRGMTVRGDVEIYCSGGNLFSTRVEGVFRIRKKALWYSECESARNVTIHPGSEIRTLIIETEDVTVRMEEGAIIHKTVRPTY
jgi:hypothetical protein